MIAKINFSFGTIVFKKGEIVPENICAKFPHLVEVGEAKEKKEIVDNIEKHSINISGKKKK